MELVDINRSGEVDFTGITKYNIYRIFNSCNELRKIFICLKNGISI
jgi:hypothetical protein